MENVTAIEPKQPSVDDLCSLYLIRKETLAKAKKDFEAIEKELTEKIGHNEEGAFTYKSDQFKTTTTGKINRTVDVEKVWEVKPNVDEDIFNLVFSFKPQLNVAAFKKLKESSPDTYNTIAACITAKPAKTALKVEPLS